MRRFVIGTAGHVDHGKTTLVRALTGVDTDRLPEEKRRGISIELGFAPLDLGDGLVASIVDVPGHRRLVRAMIAGATGMELVMLVVAADEGVMPQTREHVAVCELLGVTHAVVVVTKADAVDADLAAVAGEEARALLGRSLDGRGRPLLGALGRGPRGRAGGAASRAPCAASAGEAGARAPRCRPRVHRARGGDGGDRDARRGEARDGRRALRRWASARRARRARGACTSTTPRWNASRRPTRLAINLAGVALDEVKRGDVVTTDAKLRATTLFDVLVRGGHALARGAAVTVHVGTASSRARVDAVSPVDGGTVARVRTARATAIAGGDRVVLRGGVEGPSGAVVGGGVVVDARPDRRASGARRRALSAALASLDADVTARALVEAASPRALARDALPSRFAVDAVSLVRAAERAVNGRALARVGDHGWMTREQARRARRSRARARPPPPRRRTARPRSSARDAARSSRGDRGEARRGGGHPRRDQRAATRASASRSTATSCGCPGAGARPAPRRPRARRR